MERVDREMPPSDSNGKTATGTKRIARVAGWSSLGYAVVVIWVARRALKGEVELTKAGSFYLMAPLAALVVLSRLATLRAWKDASKLDRFEVGVWLFVAALSILGALFYVFLSIPKIGPWTGLA